MSNQENSKQVRTCPHCGHTGTDVNYHNEYMGGQGMVRILQCDNRTECWKRWDEKHFQPLKPEEAGLVCL